MQIAPAWQPPDGQKPVHHGVHAFAHGYPATPGIGQVDRVHVRHVRPSLQGRVVRWLLLRILRRIVIRILRWALGWTMKRIRQRTQRRGVVATHGVDHIQPVASGIIITGIQVIQAVIQTVRRRRGSDPLQKGVRHADCQHQHQDHRPHAQSQLNPS